MLGYKLVQFFCYLCGVMFLIATYMKRAALQLSDAEAFTTLLMILCGTLLFICVGTLAAVAGLLERRKTETCT